MSDEKVVQVESLDKLLAQWPFVLSGLESLNATLDGEELVDTEAFFRVHLDIAAGHRRGAIFLLTSKNDKPLGFVTAHDATSAYRRSRTLWVYCIYSNDKKQGAAKMLFDRVEKWGRDEGFTEIRSESARTSGASIRWCRSTFGLQLSKMVFRKSL